MLLRTVVAVSPMFLAACAAPAVKSEVSQPGIECVARIWIHGQTVPPLQDPGADVVNVLGPSHSGTGIATVPGHPELEYEIHQNHADHSPMGKPVPYHYAIASGPHHVGCATGTIEAGNTLRLDIISGHHGEKTPGCFIDFYNITCASTKADLDKVLADDPRMKNAKLDKLPSDCVF